MHLARQANEWTQKDLATRVNEKPPVVTEYENEADNGSELYGGMEPGEYDSILESLGGANPIIFGATKNEKDSYRRKLKSFCAENGKLFYMVKDSRCEVVRKGEVNSVIHKAHHVALNLLEFAGVMKELAERMGIDRRLSTPYHPQTNGLVERMNRSIKDLLVKSLEKKEDWDLHLPLVLMSLRSHTTRATGYSSFELVTGQKMTWPQDVQTYREGNQDFRFDDGDITLFEAEEEALHNQRIKKLEELTDVRKKARENILVEQSKYKARYDLLHNPYEIMNSAYESAQSYLTRKRMAMPNSWMGTVELQAAAELFDIQWRPYK
ncbi:hypothetical protein QR680_012913 [Steinernema hermaphroditum]|uniref:Integrase catalytic domain-containing protein n=1 Tax=Steinernema hermaphroditum TaxID=289476 RepID=A0AA39I6J0_9BILA|nr:hypothetical protein QR680_012913 [Steinernema hermaphroditum]